MSISVKTQIIITSNNFNSSELDVETPLDLLKLNDISQIFELNKLNKLNEEINNIQKNLFFNQASLDFNFGASKIYINGLLRKDHPYYQNASIQELIKTKDIKDFYIEVSITLKKINDELIKTFKDNLGKNKMGLCNKHFQNCITLSALVNEIVNKRYTKETPILNFVLNNINYVEIALIKILCDENENFQNKLKEMFVSKVDFDNFLIIINTKGSYKDDNLFKRKNFLSNFLKLNVVCFDILDGVSKDNFMEKIVFKKREKDFMISQKVIKSKKIENEIDIK